METWEIPFGEWLPDQPDYKNPGCITADNVWPSPGGYRPVNSLAAQNDKTSGVCRGAMQFFQTDGDSFVVGGTATSLFSVTGGTLTATTGLTDIGDTYWTFAQFNERVFAAAPNNNIKTLDDIDTDTSWADATGSPPQAKIVARIGAYLFVANLTAASEPFSFQNSARNDPTDWPTPGTADARQKNSGRGTVQYEYGEITGIAGDRYPIIFQERAVNRIDFVGPPLVFRITTIAEQIGCIAPRSIVPKGFDVYFLSHEGFKRTDGNEVVNIGTDRVNQWFFDNVSEGDRFRTQGAVAWEKECIIWSFYPADNPTGYNKQIIYNWVQNRWSTATVSVDWIVDNKIAGISPDDWDPLFPSGADTVTPGPDSAYWKARTRVLSALVQDGSGNTEVNLFNGLPLEATFETGDAQPVPGRRASVSRIYPILENVSQNTTAAVVTRAQKGGSPTTSAFGTICDGGYCPARGSGRFVRAKVVVPANADWDKAQGVQIAGTATGSR